MTIKVLIMAAAISIGFSDQARAAIADWQRAPHRMAEAIDAGMGQVLQEIEASIVANEMSDGTVGMRSRNLRQAITSQKTGFAEGVVGTRQGPTSAYARTILGPDTTTIRPKRAKHLWVPIADNLDANKVAKHTPRALFDQFGDRVRIFKSKRGNTVVFVEDPRNDDGSRSRFQRRTKAGRKRGDLKGKLVFVLKAEVTIEGTDALAAGVQRMLPRAQQILSEHVEGVFE